jgi:hypothetical protein
MAQSTRPSGLARWLFAALTWSMLVVLIVWAERVLGSTAYGTKRLLVRAGTVVLVVPMLFFHPAALVVAWLLAFTGLVASIPGWVRTGAPPLPLWSLIVAAAFVTGAPALLRKMPAARRDDQPPAPDEAPAPPPVPETAPVPTETDPDRLARYGTDLAARIADYLQAGGAIAEVHREYCGTGLCFQQGRFLYDEVEDAMFRSLRSPAHRPLASFADRQSFVAWLADQSDDSLSGRERGDPAYTDNQRITRRRLEQALADWARRRPN